jgi:predicted phage tail protein
MSEAVLVRPVQGGKGGESKPKQPSIASNSTPSIATARIIYLWSWGPIVGPVNGLRSVKLDGTPLVAEDGTVNYPGVKWQFRNGELNQERLDGIAESSNEIDVNQTLLSTTPWLHTITNAVIDAVRIRFAWPQLQSQDQAGNINGVRIDYAIDVQTDSGPFVQMLSSSVDRKNVTKYERSHRIDLPAGSRWTIRARRLTPEANSSLVQDGMVIEAIAQVVDSDQEYPLTAVGCVEYDAQQFGGDIAKIAVLMRGRIVRIPSNYDPETRTYATGGPGTSNRIWDGTFKEAYTNNPAWIFYDLVLDPYYGLGERVDATMIDRWNLYRIGQYCDQMVPDGADGMEPRFTCNLYLQKQADAYAALQDLAAVFHGMSTWDGSQITVNADMPGDPVYTYNPSQILNNGEIKYAGTRSRDRHNLAMVTWDNPAQGFDTDKEPVFDDEGLAELGSVNEMSVEAYGCTSHGQAQRAGQWALLTEQTQIRGASFRVGLDGQIPKPGQIIAVADPMLAGRANGGRINSVTGRVVTVDRDIELPAGGKLRVNLPSGKSEARVITSVSGRKVTVAAAYSETPEAESGWILEFDDLKTMQFLVRNITRPEWHQFQLDCIQHEPSKFDAIDFGAVIDDRPISGIPVGTQDPPAQVLLSQHVVIDQGIAVTVMTIAWSSAIGAVAYDIEWRWGSREWVKAPRTGELSVDVRGIYSGQYLARVRAVSALNVSSLPTSSTLTDLLGKVGLPPAVTSLTTESLIFGIGLKWTFPPGAEDTQRTEIWYSAVPNLESATKLADLAYPQSDYTMQGLRAGQSFFFWARLIDRTGNVGPWYPVAPTVVNGQASADADDILEYLTGKITESELGKELLSEIGQIGGDGPGSVNERLDQVRTELGDQITGVNNTVAEVQAELQAQIDQIGDLADSMPYKPTDTYTVGQGTLGEDGIIYQAIKAVPINTPPPNTEFWLNVGQAVQTANGLAARVNTAETKITSIEGVNTSQASQISGLQTSLTGKADSSVVSSLSSRVTTAENSISSQGTAITGLQNSVAGKADSSTVQALSNKVTQQGTDLTAAGSAITTINANLASVGGENLFYNPSFDKPWPTSPALIADGWSVVGGATNLTTALVASTLDTAGKAQRTNLTLQSATAYADLGANVDVEPKVAPGTVVTASAYFRSTVGIIAQMYIQWRNAAGTIISTDGPANLNGSDNWQRISRTSAAAPAGTVSVRVLLRTRGPVDGTPLTGFSEWDRAQFELSPTVSGWKDNGKVTASDLTAQAAATTALTGRVTQTETGLTSVSGQITTLNNSLGSAGGDNLLPNSSFELPAPIDASRPQYWRGDMGDGALPVFTWVDSPLPSSTKALRVSKPSLIVNGYIGPTFAPEDGPRPKVIPGQSYTLSAYVRLSSSGARFAMYMVFVNEAGTVVSAPQLPETVVGTTFTRLSMTAIAPAGATRLQIYPARLLNRSGAVATDMWMEVDNVQLQEGTIPTAYSPSVQGVETQVSATSTAVASLQSTVGQQGTMLTSQSADITSLKNTIGSAAPFVAGYAWEFLNTNRNWIPQVSGSTMTPGALYSTVSKYTQIQATDSFGKINGSENPYLRIRLRRKATSRAQAAMYWANEDGGLAEARRFNWNINLATEDWQDIELDLSGHAGWNGKTGIWAIRLDMMVPADANGVIDIAYIAVGRRSAAAAASALDALTSRVTSSEGTVTSVAARTTSLESTINNGTTGLATKASAQALSNLQTTVTSQGNTITSQASQITNLNATVGNQSAAIQTQAQAIADTNGNINASYSVKLMSTTDGRKVVAGFGLGLGNESGVTQSQFIVSADRFGVLNASLTGGTVTSPFIVEGGQVFIADAVIKKATITNAIIGQTIYSQTYTNYGQPVMTSDYNNGQITIQNRATQGKYLILREDGLFAVSGGVVMLELSL